MTGSVNMTIGLGHRVLISNEVAEGRTSGMSNDTLLKRLKESTPRTLADAENYPSNIPSTTIWDK